MNKDVVLLRLAPLAAHEAKGLLVIVPHDLAAAELAAVQKRAFLRWRPQVLEMINNRQIQLIINDNAVNKGFWAMRL